MNNKALLSWLSLILQERYDISFILECQDEAWLLKRSDHPGYVIFPRRLEGFYKTSEEPLPCAFWKAEKEQLLAPIEPSLPQPGLTEPSQPLLYLEGQVARVNYDILGLVYWMLSRQEEVGRTDLDSHARFPAKSSHAYQYGYLERPIVDEWLIILQQILQKLWPDLTFKEHHFSVKVSHDVDRPSRFGFASPKDLLRKIAGSAVKKDWSSALYAPIIRLGSQKQLHPKDPFNTFEWLMDVSDTHGLKSAFYFICGKTSTMDADYTLNDEPIRQLLVRIHERGHEIGLHPSYNTYRSKSAFLAEARNLSQTCAELGISQSEFGGRMHYLRWQPATLLLWEASGMTYESSLSYADAPGFRCGTCYEYPAIDPESKRILNLRIRPLIVMEGTIMSPAYLGLGDGERALEKILSLKLACERVHGCFTLLWHNSEFDGHKPALYEAVLQNK